MGRIFIRGDSKIKMGGSSILRYPYIPPSPNIVSNGPFSLKVENGQWIFNLNNPENFDGKIEIQVVNFKQTPNFFYEAGDRSQIRTKKPTFPAYFGVGEEGMYGSVEKGTKLLDAFSNINLTQWVEKLIFENMILGSKFAARERNGNAEAKKFLDISFCIKYKDDTFHYILPTIRLNFPWDKVTKLESKPSFQTNYNLNNQTIQIES